MPHPHWLGDVWRGQVNGHVPLVTQVGAPVVSWVRQDGGQDFSPDASLVQEEVNVRAGNNHLFKATLVDLFSQFASNHLRRLVELLG